MAYDPANPQGNSGASPFDTARRQAQQQAEGQAQSSRDAMSRRFASMGMQNSGAAVKSDEDINRTQAQNQQDAQGNINLQEEQQSVPFALQGQQQNFQAGQSALGREQQTQMQQRELGQQQGQFTAAQAQQQGQFNAGQYQQQRQFDVSSDLERQAQMYNEDLSKFEAGQASNPFSGTNMSKYAGGILGSGAGAGIAAIFSDERLKKNVRKLHRSIYKEVPTYLFEYINPEHGIGTKVGTMAQDLLKINRNHPAVINTPNGYMVDYSKVEVI